MAKKSKYTIGDMIIVVNCDCDKDGSSSTCSTFDGPCTGKIGKIKCFTNNSDAPYQVVFIDGDRDTCVFHLREIDPLSELGKALYGY